MKILEKKMTKSPIEQAREYLKDPHDIYEESVCLRSHLNAVIDYAESLERQLKKPDCPKCYDTGKLHGCQKMTEHGLKYYSKDCDCKAGE